MGDQILKSMCQGNICGREKQNLCNSNGRTEKMDDTLRLHNSSKTRGSTERHVPEEGEYTGKLPPIRHPSHLQINAHAGRKYCNLLNSSQSKKWEMMVVAEGEKYASLRQTEHGNTKNHINQPRAANVLIITFTGVEKNYAIATERNRDPTRSKEPGSSGLVSTLAIEALHPVKQREAEANRSTIGVYAEEGSLLTSLMENRNLNIDPFNEPQPTPNELRRRQVAHVEHLQANLNTLLFNLRDKDKATTERMQIQDTCIGDLEKQVVWLQREVGLLHWQWDQGRQRPTTQNLLGTLGDNPGTAAET